MSSILSGRVGLSSPPGPQSCVLALNLFERLPFGLRHPPEYEQEPDDTDTRIQPESPGGTEGRVERREREGKHEARDPQRRYRYRYREAANAVREDLRDEHPCHRRQGHRVAADGGQSANQNGHAL